jgi:E3 ubiquitin-protein ligase MARCH6
LLPLSVVEDFFERDTPLSRWAEPQFAALGKQVRLGGVTFQEKWVKMALGSGTYETIFAVVLGYHVFGVLLLMYLNVLTVGSMRSAGKAVRNAVRQQLLVAKVGFTSTHQAFCLPCFRWAHS